MGFLAQFNQWVREQIRKELEPKHLKVKKQEEMWAKELQLWWEIKRKEENHNEFNG